LCYVIQLDILDHVLDALVFRYCAVAPTILAGQIDPFLFEALYVSDNFMFVKIVNYVVVQLL